MSRKRKENFTEYDKTLLLNLIEGNQKILECKKNDLKTIQTRAKVWDNIADSFNSDTTVGVKRSSADLKDLYKRLKIEAKKQYTDYTKKKRATGGGEKPTSPDKFSKQVYQLIPQDFEPCKNPYDDDSDIMLATLNSNTAEGTPEAQPDVIELPPDTKSIENPAASTHTQRTSQQTADNMCTKKDSTSISKKKSCETSLEEQMKIYAQEEHSLRMEYMVEKKKALNAKMELIELKKQNELAKAKLIEKQFEAFE